MVSKLSIFLKCGPEKCLHSLRHCLRLVLRCVLVNGITRDKHIPIYTWCWVGVCMAFFWSVDLMWNKQAQFTYEHYKMIMLVLWYQENYARLLCVCAFGIFFSLKPNFFSDSLASNNRAFFSGCLNVFDQMTAYDMKAVWGFGPTLDASWYQL